MANDIFTAVKGLTSPSDVVAPQNPSSSVAERARRARDARLLRQNANTQNALAFFKGKRLLGGNLLQGGGTSVDSFVTLSLFGEIQKDEDDAFALLLHQAQERIAKNQFRPSIFNPVSAEERVRRLLENAPQAQEPQPYRYSSYDPQAEKRRQEEQLAHIDAIVQATTLRLNRALLEGELPDTSQRPRISDLLPQGLSETKLDGSIDLRLSRRLAHLDLDTNTPTQKLVLDKLLRLRRSSSFVGLTTTQIEEKQQELGLTDAQRETEQKKDAAGIPTHVQVTLQGRNLNLDPAFVETQRRFDPDFQIESHKIPTGSLVLDGNILPSRTAKGILIRHTLTYEEYQRLEYSPPALNNEEQIDYFSAIAFRHPDGSQAVLDDKASRGSVQTVALTTPETPSVSTLETLGADQYRRYDISLPTEYNSPFREVELVFENADFTNSAASNILEALQNRDLVIEAIQQGYNKSYSDDRKLTLDYEDLRNKLDDLVDNDNSVRFLFFAPDAARNGAALTLYVREQGTPPALALALEGVRARFL